MHSINKGLFIFWMVAVLFWMPLAPSLGQEEAENAIPDSPTLLEDPAREEKDAGQIAFDLVLVRPFGLLATALGSAVFVVSLPFSASVEGGVKQASEKLVKEPARFTFKRPLGEF